MTSSRNVLLASTVIFLIPELCLLILSTLQTPEFTYLFLCLSTLIELSYERKRVFVLLLFCDVTTNPLCRSIRNTLPSKCSINFQISADAFLLNKSSMLYLLAFLHWDPHFIDKVKKEQMKVATLHIGHRKFFH